MAELGLAVADESFPPGGQDNSVAAIDLVLMRTLIRRFRGKSLLCASREQARGETPGIGAGFVLIDFTRAQVAALAALGRSRLKDARSREQRAVSGGVQPVKVRHLEAT